MTREITRFNFDKCFPEIESKLKQAEFIAIDAEFSGITSDSALRNSLFDSSEDRYLTVRDNIKHYDIIQFGVTAFQYLRDENQYVGTSYVFHVLNLSFDVTDLSNSFDFQFEAFDFLFNNGFDFTKLMKGGLGFLSDCHEKQLLDYLNDKCDTCPVLNPCLKSKDWIQHECERVSHWLNTAKENDVFPLTNFNSIEKNAVECFSLAKQIDETYPSAEIIQDVNGTMMVKKVSTDNNYEKINMSKNGYKDECVKSYVGFSRLFKLLVSLKKPIVGHNPLLDLMQMYRQFYEPLPSQYIEFKKKLISLFPIIYDTKFISYELREMIDREKIWDSNELSKLYQYFQTGPGFHIAKHTPSITCANAGTSDTDIFHEAGWDSYYTGFCFIRIMHIFATLNILKCGLVEKPLVSQQLLHAVKPYKNRVNIARASVNHLRLDGPDPKSKRPRLLLVAYKRHDTSINLQELVCLLPVPQRCLDLKQISTTQVIVAANSVATSKEVLGAFDGFDDWEVVMYDPIIHNSLFPKVKWLSLVSGMCLGAFEIWRMSSK